MMGMTGVGTEVVQQVRVALGVVGVVDGTMTHLPVVVVMDTNHTTIPM